MRRPNAGITGAKEFCFAADCSADNREFAEALDRCLELRLFAAEDHRALCQPTG
jgi:hypothetical protein